MHTSAGSPPPAGNNDAPDPTDRADPSHSAEIPDPAATLHRLRTDVPPSGILSTPPPIPERITTHSASGDLLEFLLRPADPEESRPCAHDAVGHDESAPARVTGAARVAGGARSGIPAETDTVPTESAASDPALVAEWMNRPHLLETWEEPWPAEHWRRIWRAQFATTYSVPVVVSYRGAPACYVEIYRPHRDEIAGCYRSHPHDLGFHIAVGDPSLTGHGIFSAFMDRLAEALLDADPCCEAVLIEPDHRNRRMHAAARKLGWCDCGERQQRADRRVRLFVRPRATLPERFVDYLPKVSTR